MTLLDEIVLQQRRLLLDLKPLPLHYRLSRAALDAVLPQVAREGVALGGSGHLFGIPFSVSPEVPDGEVWFTTDFERWHKLVGVGE